MNNLDPKYEFILWLFEVAWSVGFLAMGAGMIVCLVWIVGSLFA